MEDWQPLPAPPANYPFAAPDHLYAPRDDEPDDEPVSAPDVKAAGPPRPEMVWSTASSTWVPAPDPAPDPTPPPLVPPAPPRVLGVPLVSSPSGPPPWARPRRRRSPAQQAVAFLVGLIVLCTGGFGVISGRFAFSVDAPPAPGGHLRDLLRAQTSAMASADEAAFMSVVDPNAPGDVYDTYHRIYTNLRAMGVSEFQQAAADPDAVVNVVERYPVDVSFCVEIVGFCARQTARFYVTVDRGPAGPRIMGIDFGDDELGSDGPGSPLPWEVSDLTVAAQPGLLVAAARGSDTDLSGIMAVAKQAELEANRYTAQSSERAAYIVYVGDQVDLDTWYGGVPSDAPAVVGLGSPSPQIALDWSDASRMGPHLGEGADSALRRAMTEVALYGDSSATEVPTTTLGVGLADYAAYNGLPGADAEALAAVRTYLATKAWDGQCAFTFTGDAAAAAGIGYLAVKYLVQAYGFEKTLDFWDSVERSTVSVDTASQAEFGVTWANVNSGCAAFVRAAVK